MPTIGIPFILGSCMLVVLYWLEILSHRIKNRFTYLKRLRIPFYSYSTLAIVVELIATVARTFYVGQWAITLSVVNILFLCIILNVTIAFLSVKILRMTRSKDFVENKRLIRMRYHMIAMNLLTFFAIIMMCIFLVPSWSTSPYSLHFMIGIGVLLACAIACLQINMFQRPVSKSKLSTTDSSSKEKSSTMGDHKSTKSGKSANTSSNANMSSNSVSGEPQPSPEKSKSNSSSKASKKDSASLSSSSGKVDSSSDNSGSK